VNTGLTRKALEVLRDCDTNKMPCSECLPHQPPEQACYRFQYERGELAALALRLAEGLEDIVIVAGTAMCEANNDGAGYDVEATLAAARSLLAELEG
jgi:hypothetical protein